MEFYYHVVTKDGRRDEGILKARNPLLAREKLLSEHSSILKLEETSKISRKIEKPFRANLAKVAVFFRRLATLLGAGVQLADSLEFLIESEDDPGLRDATQALAQGVMSGQSLSAVMRTPRFKYVFDPVSIGMIQMGEQTGQLQPVVERIADQMERNLKLNRSLVSALTYPSVLLVVIIAMGLLFTLVLGPGEGGLFEAFGKEIPWPTRVVQSVSQAIKNPWLVGGILFTLVGSFLGVKRLLEENATARMRFHSLLLQAPMIGALVEKTECARLLYIMADGLNVGLPAIKCMAMARDACANDRMRLQFSRVIRTFSDGEEMAASFSSHGLFPEMVISMLEVGVESGKLDTVMRQVCDNYEEDVQMTLDNVARLAEPLLLAFAGAMAAFLALATLLPIINMVNTLG